MEILDIPNQLLDMGRTRRTKLVIQKMERQPDGSLCIDIIISWGPYKWVRRYAIPTKEINNFTIEDFKITMLELAEKLKREEQNNERIMAGIKDFIEKPVYLD